MSINKSKINLMKGSDFKGQTFYKIMNKDENNNGFIYKKGLNIINEKLSEKLSIIGNSGFNFTTLENLDKFYSFGIWIRKITLPSDANIIIDPNGYEWRTDRIILGKRYYLFSIKSINKFGLFINNYYTNYVFNQNTSANKIPAIGNKEELLKVLNWFNKTGITPSYFDKSYNSPNTKYFSI